jgi:3-methylfumaryl-CoA hydratase
VTPQTELTETLVPGPAEALAGLLDQPVPDLDDGLPLMWHVVYLLDRPVESELGVDGHRAAGGVPLPPGPGRRRMFAGGRVRQEGVLRLGHPATRRSWVSRTEDKVGRTGRLEFVTVRHQISQDGAVVVDEEQDLVYRAAAESRSPATQSSEPAAPVGPDDWVVGVDPVLLFRFSALTYNAHRIHYDRDFARSDGYPGLVVHGPLQAVLMAHSVGRRRPGRHSFSYRLQSPLFEGEGLVVTAARDGEEVATSVRSASGRITATGRLTNMEIHA